MSNKKGFTSLVMLAVAVVILGAAIVLYFFLNNGGQSIVSNTFNYNQESRMKEEPQEVSDSSEIGAMEAELNATTINDTSSDFAELDSDLQSL